MSIGNPDGASWNDPEIQNARSGICAHKTPVKGQPFPTLSVSPLPVEKILDRYWPDVAHDAAFNCAKAILSSNAFAPQNPNPALMSSDTARITTACSNGVGVADVQLKLRQMSTSMMNPCDNRLKKISLYFISHPLLAAVFTEAFLLDLDMAKAVSGDSSVVPEFQKHIASWGLQLSATDGSDLAATFDQLVKSSKGTASSQHFTVLAKIVQALTDKLKQKFPKLNEVLSRMEEARARRAAAAEAEELMLGTPLGK